MRCPENVTIGADTDIGGTTWIDAWVTVHIGSRCYYVVEIGVFGGGSLPMWRTYFGERSRIYGVFANPPVAFMRGPGIEIVIGDQSSPAFWEAFRALLLFPWVM